MEAVGMRSEDRAKGGRREEKGKGKEEGFQGIWGRKEREGCVGQNGCKEQGIGQPATVNNISGPCKNC